jgi:hypothetical protein
MRVPYRQLAVTQILAKQLRLIHMDIRATRAFWARLQWFLEFNSESRILRKIWISKLAVSQIDDFVLDTMRE